MSQRTVDVWSNEAEQVARVIERYGRRMYAAFPGDHEAARLLTLDFAQHLHRRLVETWRIEALWEE